MNKILTGNSLDVLKTLEGNSIDSVITDPPYGYSFMGKDWDKAVPSVEIWQECLRVLKPGAFCMVMSAPRSDVQMHMISNLEQAGFRIDFTPIYWTYASGFPKAGNIGKMVDKRNGRDPALYQELANCIKLSRSMTRKELALHILTNYKNIESAVAQISNWELGKNVPTMKDWIIMKSVLNLDNSFDELIEREEAEREVIGRKNVGIKNGSAGGSHEYGLKAKQVNITAAYTDQAKALDGSYAGFQPKPAVEVIIVAMKPLSEKTFVDQALKNGKGITWLDDCRIPTGDTYSDSSVTDKEPAVYDGGWKKRSPADLTQGRFPANLLVSDDVLNDGTVTKSAKQGFRKSANGSVYRGDSLLHSKTENQGTYYFGDSGSYSRYFDLDKWYENQKAPRGEEQTGHISNYSEDIIPQTLPFLIVPKASKSEKNKGLEHREGVNNKNNMQTRAEREGRGHRSEVVSKNNHPTVKPLKLMSYLITLFSRPGDTVLDPFCGSGTTCIAAKMLKREYIGIEREAEYVEIAEARLKAHEPDNQLELLDVG